MLRRRGRRFYWLGRTAAAFLLSGLVAVVVSELVRLPAELRMNPQWLGSAANDGIFLASFLVVFGLPLALLAAVIPSALPPALPGGGAIAFACALVFGFAWFAFVFGLDYFDPPHDLPPMISWVIFGLFLARRSATMKQLRLGNQ